MKLPKHIKLIRKLADRKARKLVNAADKRAEQIQVDYLKKTEKHDKIFTARIKYCENLREKTEKECDELKTKTLDKCQDMERKRRALLVETIRQNNEVQKRAKNIEDKYEAVRTMFSDTAVEAHKSENATDKAMRLQ